MIKSTGMTFKVLAKVGVHVFKHQNQGLASVHYIMKGDNVGVFQATK